MRTLQQSIKAFLSKLVFLDNGCWKYREDLEDDEYGRIMFQGKRVKAHRFAWEVYKGPIPEGKQVLHKCDYPPCVNPEHLFLGDHAANMRDMAQKGRGVKVAFENNPNCKYSWETVKLLCHLATVEQLNSFEIEFLTAVPSSTVRCILNGRAWAT